MLRVLCAALAALLPFACNRVPEPPPPPDAAPASATPDALPTIVLTPSADASPPATANASANAPASANASANAPASASANASASASAIPLSPLATRLLGTWTFSKFDLGDPATATKWKAIPEGDQKEILKEAPKASIEFTSTHIVSRLAGVPDKKSTWSVETELDGELTIKTSDDGRKKVRFVGDDLRIVDLDKKDGFATLFAKKK